MDLSNLHQEAKIQLLVNASLDEFNRLVKLNKEFNRLAYSPPTSERVFKERSERYFPDFIQFKDLDKSLPIPENRKYQHRENKFSVAGIIRKPISWQEFYKRVEALFRNIETFSNQVRRDIGYSYNYENNAANNLIAENKLMEAIILSSMPDPIYPTENAVLYSLTNANLVAFNYLYAIYPGLFATIRRWVTNEYLVETMESNDVSMFERAREIRPFPITSDLLLYEYSPRIVEYLLQNYPELELDPQSAEVREFLKQFRNRKTVNTTNALTSYYSQTEEGRETVAIVEYEYNKLIPLLDLLIRYGKLSSDIEI